MSGDESRESLPAPPTVWLLEDSPTHAGRFGAMLGEQYRLEHFADGAALLERLSQGGAPDVLVLDCALPGLGGIEVCRFVRQSRDELALPILMYTGARADSDGLLDSLAAGVNDFVAKSCPPAELLARLRTLVRVSQLHARAHRAEQARRETARLQASTRERFIGILGHDLRSPLAAVLMSAQLQRLDLPADAAPARHLVGVIERSARRMERMIADLLDFARARSEEGIPITRGAVDLGALCRRVIDELTAADPTRDLRLEAEPGVVGQWDADRMEQVVSNLVANALAYRVAATPVTVTVRGEAAEATIEVINEGSIDAQALAALFDPYRRGAGASGRPATGVGLGLYIVQSIVRAHGGAVEAGSAGGRTTFRVTLPRAAERSPP
ncbi:MAG: Sensor protein [Myxococcaceae bacterium]|nr:Sensor protein [Myxococcaceae bacterium]